MRETLNRLLRLAAGYSLITLIGPLVTILLTPLYTRVLEPADYGVVDVVMTLSGFISLSATLSVDQALNSHFYTGDEAFRRNLVTTALRIVVVLGASVSLMVFVLARPLAQLLFNDVARYVTLWLLSLNLLCAPIYSVCATALRLRMGVRRVNALGITYLVALATLNIVLVVVLRLKATGIVGAYTGANMVGAIAGFAFIRKPLHGNWSAQQAKLLLKTGLGMMPSIFGLMVIANSDRLILTQNVTPQELGLYAIANKLAALVSVAVNLVMTAWVPMAIEMAPRPGAPQQFSRIYEYFLAGSCVIALTVGVFISEIIQIFARPLYVPAAPYAIFLMAYSGPILASAAIFSIGLYARQQTHRLSWAYYVAAPLNIVLNLIFIPMWGLWGAVFTTIIAGVALALVTYMVCQPVYFVPYRWLRSSALVIAYFVLMLGTFYLTQINAVTLAWKFFAILVMIALCFAIGVIKFEQIQRLLRYLFSYKIKLK